MDEELEPNVGFRCNLRSRPGMWAQYDGHVDIYAPKDADDEELFKRAVKQLSRTSFPDRPSLSSWIFESAQRLN